MSKNVAQALLNNFLGTAPSWYKKVIIAFLIFNPISFIVLGPFITGWMLIAQFILTLAMALKCYPLQPGGLLAIEAVAMGMTSTEAVFAEAVTNIDVIFLLMFMVAGIYFMKDLLLYVFTKILVKVKSKMALSLLFASVAALLSAFLDALTVTAALISVSVGFYSIYHKVASGKEVSHEHDINSDSSLYEYHRRDLDEFRAFLRSLMMHGAVGTALGGVCTLVGEPQNLLIAKVVDWQFMEFFMRMMPVTMPALAAGILTVIILEATGWFGYGAKLPAEVRSILEAVDTEHDTTRTKDEKAAMIVQGAAAVFLIVALAFHLAAVGIIGLAVIVILTALNGIVDEGQIGKSFEAALPFTALLVIFFSIVAIIHEQQLFNSAIAYVLAMDEASQPGMLFIVNGLLSAISDNVFVATIYIEEVKRAFDAGSISREHFEMLAVAINTGTNLPSVATPNGQAAFLFLLTSALAPLIRLSYGRMVMMALPYTVVLSIVGYFAVTQLL